MRLHQPIGKDQMRIYDMVRGAMPGGKRCNHQELADALERGGETRGDDADAAQNGHCKKAKDEPGENGLHIDLDAMVAALRGGLLL